LNCKFSDLGFGMRLDAGAYLWHLLEQFVALKWGISGAFCRLHQAMPHFPGDFSNLWLAMIGHQGQMGKKQK